VITVRDRGLGISTGNDRQDLRDVFPDPRRAIERSKRRPLASAWLLARRIVDLHGGVQSRLIVTALARAVKFRHSHSDCFQDSHSHPTLAKDTEEKSAPSSETPHFLLAEDDFGRFPRTSLSLVCFRWLVTKFARVYSGKDCHRATSIFPTLRPPCFE